MHWLLRDFIQINPDRELEQLSVKDKNRLIDQVLGGPDEQKGLRVSFYLSHSGRRINNRVYTPWGQQAGISSLTSPYPKPLIRNHDSSSEPLGRFTDGRYEDIGDQAVRHFSKMQDFVALNQAFESKDAEKTAALLYRSKVLFDSKWQGLGRMHVSARVTDKDAIEKFLDGRYLTFSGGFDTDRLNCSICMSDWRKGDFCEHRPGEIVDGKPVFFLAGSYNVKEASVVLDPADDLSQVTSLQFIDSVVPSQIRDSEFLKTDMTTIYVTDSQYSFSLSQEELMAKKKIPETEVEVVQETPTTDQVSETPTLKQLCDAVLAKDYTGIGLLIDALDGETVLEAMTISKINDSLHYQYDYDLKYSDPEEDPKIPRDVFKLHAKVHETAMAGGFRDSFTNGPLDHYDADGQPTDAFMYVDPTMDSSKDETIEDSISVEQLDTAFQVTVETIGVPDGVPVAQTETETKEEKEEDEEEVDWVLIDLDLQAELGDATLSAEARKKLSKTTFCGPGKSFPVPDKAHYLAALRLLNRANYSASIKAKIKACVMRKGKENGWASEDQNVTDQVMLDKYQALKDDYINALSKTETLQLQLEEVLACYAKMHGKDFIVKEDERKLDLMLDWYSSFGSKETTEQELKPVVNPSVDSSYETSVKKQDKLGEHEKKIVERYYKFLDEFGEQVAETWFQSNRRYLPPKFHPKDYKL